MTDISNKVFARFLFRPVADTDKKGESFAFELRGRHKGQRRGGRDVSPSATVLMDSLVTPLAHRWRRRLLSPFFALFYPLFDHFDVAGGSQSADSVYHRFAKRRCLVFHMQCAGKVGPVCFVILYPLFLVTSTKRYLIINQESPHACMHACL